MTNKRTEGTAYRAPSPLFLSTICLQNTMIHLLCSYFVFA
nr:MAG TPA: hypothetical protein [Caudoviricetes sp.]